MIKRKKLIEKLKGGMIDSRELRVLLTDSGWELDRQKGSHEIWKSGQKTLVLSTHSKNLKLYQIKEAQDLILGQKNGK